MATESDPRSVQRAIAGFDATAYRAFEHEAERQRQETLRLYPREQWPRMTLEEYAQGQADRPDNFCRWIERQTDQMGSIRGGSARKLIIYKHRDEPGWYFPPDYENERQAWEDVRAAFLSAFALADEGRWDEIDDIEPLRRGAALLTKVLWVYFPDDLLPITSSDNLRHFLRVLGREEVARDHGARSVRLNRMLLAALRSEPGLEGLSTKALERFLYMRFSPFEGRVVKIAPGHDAHLWPECRDGSFICVGWEGVGDLRQYESKDAFLAAFRDAYADTHATEAKLKEKADEVWLLLELAVGERVVANRGTKEVLAVGTIEPPGYTWDPDRDSYNHTLRVRWDESYQREVPPQPYWAFKTVLPLSNKTKALVLGEPDPSPEGVDEPAPPTSDEEPLFARIADSLERKGQTILYGPPGTGKTWHASGFARWWLEKRNGTRAEERLEANLDASPAQEGSRSWLVSTNPSHWSWDHLFERGEERFSRGRLKRNYTRAAPGDLVFGYAATPQKRVQAAALVERLEHTEGGPTFVLKPLTRISDGPSWEDLQGDHYLGDSEAVRNRMQGTLFHLQPHEAERLIALVAERDAAAAAVVSDVETQASGRPPAPLEWITFHPSYSYEDFVEGFRPVASDGDARLELEDGIFKKLCRAALANPELTYLLVVDEINRANVTKVLGELITLLEKDKRAGEEGTGYSVRLPYSKERFAIPSNLFLLGTMNTADRSIKMLDTALRRRFGFVELMPDPELLTGDVGGLRLDDLLRSLNARVARHAGREKQIGHSFFLRDGQPVSDEDEFTEVVRDELVPLLQEYAGDDYDELAEYLGSKIVDREQLTIDMEILSDPSRLLEELEQHLTEDQGGA